MRVPDGTAAVSAEFVLIDENQSLGKPEKAKNKREVKLRKRKSEDLQEEIH